MASFALIQGLTIAILVLASLAAFSMVSTEYLRCRRGFLVAAAAAQLTAVAWHIANLWVFRSGTDAAVVLSALSIYLTAFLMLDAVLSLTARGSVRPAAAIMAGAGLILTLLAVALGGIAWVGLGWFVTLLMLFSAPVILLVARPLDTKALAATLSGVALCFGGGFFLVGSGDSILGGAVYTLNGLLVATASILFLQQSIGQSHAEIARSEWRHRSLLESLKDAYFWLDSNGRIVFTSPSFAQFGYRAEDLIDTPLADIIELSVGLPDFLAQCEREDAVMMRGAVSTAAGTVRECEVTLQRAGTIELDVAFAGAVRDIHERNELERQFLDAQRRESLGTISGGIAHDFNNLLQGIILHTELLGRGSGEARDHIAGILSASETASELCSRLLQYSGNARMDAREVSFSAVVEDVVKMMPRERYSSRIRLTDESGGATILADATMMKQLVLNIVQNALDASAEDRRVSIRLGVFEASESRLADAHLFGEFPDGNAFVGMDVIDTGSGIGRDDLLRIFDPFFTTREEGHGLGLSAVRGILDQHRGVAFVRSRPGHGTTFRILLPQCGIESAGSIGAPATFDEGAGRTILLVDDEKLVLNATTKVLEAGGYRVRAVSNGADAMAVLDAPEPDISLVVSDITMPGMNGIELVRALRVRHPDLPVVLVSGFHSSLQEIGSLAGPVFFIAKPFGEREIFGMIDRALSEPQSTGV